ncbi:MAG: RimK family alpha-L-glutamate ligase, partial [Candidatus Aenigmarchaeota archaeon]|nr:RimK family alpha-L-glutamate ligase [Candidatus Aenigmarchaeota archaeon]
DVCILGPMIKKQQELWLIEEAKKRFDKVTYAEIPYVRIKNNEVYLKHTKLSDYDCVLPRIPRTYMNYGYLICKLLENRVFLPLKPESIITTHNKFLTLEVLDKAEIPIPKTYVALTRTAMMGVLDKIKYPVVIKLLYGSLGKGVMFAESRQSAIPLLDTMETMNKPFLVEEYIKNPGEDIRALVIGNSVAAAMRRKAGRGERRANIGAGGTGKKIKLPPEIQDLAIRTAKALGLGITGVDIIMSERGPLVIEANVNVYFEGITEATGINLAEQMINYMWDEAETAKKGHIMGHFFRVVDRLKIK